jgi:hypothetical protein
MLHFRRLRNGTSKVYTPNEQSIAINNDREHESLPEHKQ